MPTHLTDIQYKYKYNITLKLFLRSKTPTAKLKLRGITIEVHEHSPNVNYIILLKKSKTKLVLKADSPAEFDGWLRTIKTVSELKTGEGEQVSKEESIKSKHRYENVEVSETENGKELVKIKGKAPVPTPRSKTPSLEMTSLQTEKTESIVTINSEDNNTNMENSPRICKKNENGTTKIEDKDHLSVENTNNHDNQSIVDNNEADNSETEENLIKPCLPIPVSASSEDSTSSSSDADEEKPRFCTPIISMGHKFSDGIVWETIEECDEENISSGESDKVDTGMNHAEKEADVVNMKIDFHEGSSVGVMTAGSAPDKKARLQPHAPFITATQAEKDCDSLSLKVGKSSPPPQARMVDYSVRYQQDLIMKGNEVTNGAKDISVNEDVYDCNECAFCPDKKEPPVSKEEIGNISVKNLAKFWEQVSQQKIEDSAVKEAAIQKKWNSMPNLKERKQQKQDSIKEKKEPVVHYAEVVKSDEIIDDVDLCRSVSLSDRKQMFEMMTLNTIGEQSKQWKSMPSLKQDKSPSASTSTSPRQQFKSRVRWEDQSDIDDFAIERGRSPVRELVKNFQTPQSLVCFKRGSSPLSPEFKSNEIRTHESLSSSDSISSSMTGSSVSTVIDTRTRPASHLDDSSGEIYTDSSVTDMNTGEEGPYVFENGAEYSLTSLGMGKECRLFFYENPKVIM